MHGDDRKAQRLSKDCNNRVIDTNESDSGWECEMIDRKRKALENIETILRSIILPALIKFKG